MMHSIILRAAVPLLVVSCAEPIDTRKDVSAIIGGEMIVEGEYDAVVELFLAGFSCSATVVSNRVVLTAAHCLDDVIRYGQILESQAAFGVHTHGDGSNPDKLISLVDARIHRYWNVDADRYYDIGLALLAEDAGVEPITVDGVTPDVKTGDLVRTIGYGRTSPSDSSTAGKKRRADLSLQALAPHYLQYQSGDQTCLGDSGGPHILGVGADQRVVAVTSLVTCFSGSSAARVDRYWEEFVAPTMDSWEGPCKLDGVCTTAGCRTPDPDCDPCGLDGTCAADCPSRDLDCPLSGLFGERCESARDCESGLCATATEDARTRYCTLPCDFYTFPAACIDANMECLPDPPEGMSERICTYRTPTPGAQGATCTDDASCASGTCDKTDGICAWGCSETQACADGYQCSCYEGQDVCALPAEGAAMCPVAGDDCPCGGDDCDTGCSCSTAGGPGAAWWLVLLAMIAVVRRRRVVS